MTEEIWPKTITLPIYNGYGTWYVDKNYLLYSKVTIPPELIQSDYGHGITVSNKTYNEYLSPKPIEKEEQK